MRTTYRIPASATDVFETETIIESPRITVPKITIATSGDSLTTQPADVAESFTFSRSMTRSFVGVVTAVHLGIQPLIRDERANASWVCVERSNETTPRRSRDEVIEESLRNILCCMPAHELEDGMTWPLGIGLAAWFEDFGETGLAKLASVAVTNKSNLESLSHALRWIGRIDNPDSVQARLRLLIGLLNAPSGTVKDGAALGLVELGSPLAIAPLENAARTETNTSLQRDLEQAAEYLKQSS